MVRLLAVAVAAVLSGLAAGDALSDLEKKGRPQLDAALATSKTCTADKLRVRREWGDMPAEARHAYIDAVLCLTRAPSKLDPKRYPGAKSRYDDFIAVHINQTMRIHDTGNFLSWHRYYTWAYENVLRTECAYNGTQPYWDWGRWAADPEKSPIFDGSDTSIGGNGEFIAGHRASAYAPAGNGGGCIKSGPFKNMTTYFGPISPAVDPSPPRNPRSDGYGSNPRCVRRDIGNSLSSRYGRTQDIVALVSGSKDIVAFQSTMQKSSVGVHGVGHYTIGGDPGGDFYTSPGDPAFWFHHAMIDRTWTIWQNLDLPARQMAMQGPASMGGGRQQSLDDLVDLDVVGAGVFKIRDLMNTVDGPFCYVYEAAY